MIQLCSGIHVMEFPAIGCESDSGALFLNSENEIFVTTHCLVASNNMGLAHRSWLICNVPSKVQCHAMARLGQSSIKHGAMMALSHSGRKTICQKWIQNDHRDLYIAFGLLSPSISVVIFISRSNNWNIHIGVVLRSWFWRLGIRLWITWVVLHSTCSVFTFCLVGDPCRLEMLSLREISCPIRF